MFGTGYNPGEASAEGGNRTLIPGGNTILSRARLPIPPLRLVSAPKYTTPNKVRKINLVPFKRKT